MILVVRDARPSSRHWEFPALASLLEGVRDRLCADLASRAPFHSAARAMLARCSDTDADDAVLAFARDDFPVHWTLRHLGVAALGTCNRAADANEVALSGSLVDAWMVAAPGTHRAACLAFLLTATVLHALAHALQTRLQRDAPGPPSTLISLAGAPSCGCKGCGDALERAVWGGRIGALWAPRCDGDFAAVAGVFVEVERDGDRVDVQLTSERVQNALDGQRRGSVDLGELAALDNFPMPPVGVVRRRQSCVASEPDEESPDPWEDDMCPVPVAPPNLFYTYDSDVDLEGEE